MDKQSINHDLMSLVIHAETLVPNWDNSQVTSPSWVRQHAVKLRSLHPAGPLDSEGKRRHYHVTGHVTGNTTPAQIVSNSRLTIRDVATRAGVSHQTVSRVINQSERVGSETRRRVEAAIAELGYRPNAVARDMALGRTHTFACMAPNLTDYTFANIIEGATTEAQLHGYYLISACAPNDEAFSDLVDQLIATRRAEGMIVINPYADGRHSRVPTDVPAVFVGARPREEAIGSIALDDEKGGMVATQHLIQLGHKAIVHITGPLSEDCAQDRRTGYLRALQGAGLASEPRLIREGDWSATAGYEAVGAWIRERVPFTALFAQNDLMAIGAIRALREAGRPVPQHVSVVGFDDIPLASYFDPALTTMRQDTFAIGQEAARRLLQAVEQPGSDVEHLRLPVELIVRQTTSRP